MILYYYKNIVVDKHSGPISECILHPHRLDDNIIVAKQQYGCLRIYHCKEGYTTEHH